jgi:type I restriction enzyme S subunit
VWGDDFDPEGTIVLRSTEQTVGGGWSIVDPARRSLTATERAAGLLATNDLLITKSSGSELHIGKTSIVTEEVASLQCCFSNFMQRLRCSNVLLPKLVFYVLNSPIGREQFVYGSNTTTGLANLNGHVIGNLTLAVPPLDEQRAITAFLDRETVRIDTLIGGLPTNASGPGVLTRLVTLLHEYRSALISAAVTGKIDVRNSREDAPCQ